MDRRQKLRLAAMLLVKNQYLFERKLKLLLLKLLHNVKIVHALATINLNVLLQVGIAEGHPEIRERQLWKFDRNSTFWEFDVPSMDDNRFKENFRLNRKAFQKLSEKVQNIERLDTNMRLCIPLEKRVAIALFALGSAAEYRTVGSLFGVGRSTVGEIVIDFCHAICNNLSHYINSYPPNPQEIKHIVDGFEHLGFPQCFGAVDGCHIEIQPKKEDAVDYHNYKGWYSVILLASCDYSESYGTCLILDGIIQCTSRDEFSYQEMISFLPLCSHPNPKKVLIVGGGDGGVAREVVKHPLVEEVHQVEIDERVVELSKQFLPNMASGFNNPKLTLTIGDGFEYMKNHKHEFDVIITDSSDPIGPAISLFNENYYKLMKTALRGRGIVCSQGGSFWLDSAYVRKTINDCGLHFPNVAYAVTSIPSYPCGHIGFMVGCLDELCSLEEPVHTFSSTEIDNMNLKYYSSSIHSASFVLPRSVQKFFYE